MHFDLRIVASLPAITGQLDAIWLALKPLFQTVDYDTCEAFFFVIYCALDTVRRMLVAYKKTHAGSTNQKEVKKKERENSLLEVFETEILLIWNFLAELDRLMKVLILAAVDNMAISSPTKSNFVNL